MGKSQGRQQVDPAIADWVRRELVGITGRQAVIDACAAMIGKIVARDQTILDFLLEQLRKT